MADFKFGYVNFCPYFCLRIKVNDTIKRHTERISSFLN